MNGQETITLTRNVEAYIVPTGDKVELIEGELVQITQSLGASFTVMLNGNMFQIDGKNADALGYEPPKPKIRDSQEDHKQLNEDMIWEQLRMVYDPEIPVNIVDLGLIYDLAIDYHDDGKADVKVKMTLTAPGCGMGGVIAGEAEQNIISLSQVESVSVELVWDPQWSRDMMSENARLQLGMF